MKVLSKTKRILFIMLAVAISVPTLAYSNMIPTAIDANSIMLTGGEKAKDKRVQLSTQKIPSRSLAVLRTYLPQFVDIHKAENLTPESAYLPVTPKFDPSSPFIDPELRFKLVRTIGAWLGVRYRYGGRSKRGVDCSAFTSAVMSEVLDRKFIGTSRVQAAKFNPIQNLDSLQMGDMLFFTGRNRRSSRIGHVGIYVGNGVFAHSSSGKGVIYTHLSKGYYKERFRWAGRFVSDNPPVREISHYRYVQ
jgi:cell wall-associated NlpC family hydrolase